MSDLFGAPSAASEKSIRESGRFARCRSSRRCLSVMGRVKSALAPTRLSCRDDADFFFAILFLACVHNQQDRYSTGATDRVPAFLIGGDTIRIRNQVGIVKDARRRFKRNTVLSR